MRRLLIDGLPPESASPLDWDDGALLLGLSVFETMRTYGGRPFAVAAHLARLEESAAALEVPYPGSALLAAEVTEVLEGWRKITPPGEASIRVTLTAGGRRAVRVIAIPPPSKPQHCAIRPWVGAEGMGHVKHAARAPWVWILRQSGADEVLWIDGAGNLLEASTGNIWAVVDGALWTPPLDGRILPGVTRAALIHVAAAAGIPVREEPLPLAAAESASELYLSGSLKELTPVASIEGRPAPGAGPVGERVLAAFRAYAAEA